MTTIAKASTTLLFLTLTAMSTAQPQRVQLFPITDVVPTYPTEAIVQELEGWVLASFDVTASGAASNIRVLEAEPDSTFDQSAMRQYNDSDANRIPKMLREMLL